MVSLLFQMSSLIKLCHLLTQKLGRAKDADPPGAIYERLFSAKRDDVVRGLEAAQSHVRWDGLR